MIELGTEALRRWSWSCGNYYNFSEYADILSRLKETRKLRKKDSAFISSTGVVDKLQCVFVALAYFQQYIGSSYFLKDGCHDNGGKGISIHGEFDYKENFQCQNGLEEKISGMDDVALRSILDVLQLNEKADWWTIFTAMLNILPVAVSISSASNKQPGFPLVFVNAKFESLTGYSFKEMIEQHKSCKVLQSLSLLNGMFKSSPECAAAQGTLPTAVSKLSASLRAAAPTRAVLFNVKKNGDGFVNMTTIKPMMSIKDEYRFVLATHFDGQDHNLAELIFVDLLQKLLPSVIPNGP